MKELSISKNKSKIRFTFSILLFFIISLFTACDNFLFNGNLKELITEDIGTNISFFEYNDESSQHIDKTFIIGKTVSSKDFPEFLHEETMIVGWQYLKNPRTASTEMPSNYYLNERAYISTIYVSPEPAYLYAVWKKKCTITFVTGCDVQLAPYVLPEGYTVPFEDYNKWGQNLTKPKYAFRNWYLDAECTQEFDYNEPVMGNITLYAKWVEQITVTYHSNDGTNRTQSNTYDVGTSAYVEDCYFGERSGYGFVCWTIDPAQNTPDPENHVIYKYFDDLTEPLTTDINLYAVWSTDVITITYKENCNIPGIAQNRTRLVHYGKGAHVPIGRYFTEYGWDMIYYDWNKTGYEIKGFDFSASATKENMQFKYEWGSYVNKTSGLRYYLITSDITLYAVWDAKTYNIHFMCEENDPSGFTYQYQYESCEIDYNTRIPRPVNDPVRNGYTFDNWYIQEWNYSTQESTYKLYDFSTIVNEDSFGNSPDIYLYGLFTEGGTSTGNIAANISFSESPESDISGLVTGPTETATNSITFTAASGYDEYRWYLDDQSLSTTETFTIDTSGLAQGNYNVMLVVKSGEDYYSWQGTLTKS